MHVHLSTNVEIVKADETVNGEDEECYFEEVTQYASNVESAELSELLSVNRRLLLKDEPCHDVRNDAQEKEDESASHARDTNTRIVMKNDHCCIYNGHRHKLKKKHPANYNLLPAQLLHLYLPCDFRHLHKLAVDDKYDSPREHIDGQGDIKEEFGQEVKDEPCEIMSVDQINVLI